MDVVGNSSDGTVEGCSSDAAEKCWEHCKSEAVLDIGASVIMQEVLSYFRGLACQLRLNRMGRVGHFSYCRPGYALYTDIIFRNITQCAHITYTQHNKSTTN